MAKSLIITQGKAMRAMREEGIILTFPSGNNYRVRVPGAAGLLRRGNLPNILVSFCHDLLYDDTDADAKYQAFVAPSDKAERDLELLASFKVVCQEMFMQPRVVDEPQEDDEIAIDDLSIADQTWAFWLAFVEVNALKVFRQEQELDVVSVPEPESVSPEAEQRA